MARAELRRPEPPPEDPLDRLALLLTGDAGLAPWAAGPRVADRIWALAERHRVEELLAWRLLQAPAGSGGEQGRTRARAVLAAAAAVEEIRRRELVRVAAAFADERVPLLLLKGAAWAYTLYPAAALRRRLDTDLLVDAGARGSAERLLLSLGYTAAVESVMQLASGQRHYEHAGQHGVPHFVDLHWRVANPLVFADAMPFGPLWARSVAIPALGGARTLCPPDALVLACLHRLAHHGDGSSIRWLLDVHLLAGALDEEQWNDFVLIADADRLRGVCALGLSRARARFGTSLPPAIRAWSREGASEEVDAVFRGCGVSPLGVLASDWRAIGTWSGRWALLRDHLFPAPEYMRARYDLARHAPLLPLCYLHRAVTGLGRWCAGYRESLSRQAPGTEQLEPTDQRRSPSTHRLE